jgi:dihydrofolate synthase / folylpolyglutamate synthase
MPVTLPHDTWSVSEWLEHLENRLPQEIDLRLENVRAVANKMGLLKSDVPIILVAGTNGKGSTVASLEAIYLAAGYRVGCYTSPHLLRFNERITVNQQPISDADLCFAFSLIEKTREKIALTYFETATLAGLWYFNNANLDVIILEVGMGGRLDATNIVNPTLSIVTTIDFDHQAYLGDTLEAIGYEKAGVFRTDQPCLYADYTPPVSLLEYAAVLNSQLEYLGNDYIITVLDQELVINYNNKSITLPKPTINIKAAAVAVVASLRLANKLPITQLQLSAAMRNVKILGRQQIINDSVTTIYDVAHNPQAAQNLADFITNLKPTTTVRAVFSALSDKDLGGLIRPLCKVVHDWYPAIMQNKRAANEALLNAAFHAEMDRFFKCFSDPVTAYRAALNDSKDGDLIIVFGSFVIVSAIMSFQQGVLYEISD